MFDGLFLFFLQRGGGIRERHKKRKELESILAMYTPAVYYVYD
jgi:hypothetical protein